MDNIWRNNKGRQEDEKKASQGGEKLPHPGKILWERDDNGWEEGTKRPNTGRRPVRQVRPESRWVNDYYNQNKWTGGGIKKVLTNKFVVQTVVSVLVFMVAIGIYDHQDPGSQVASRAVKYLLNVDTNFEPVMGRVVKLVFPELTTDGPVNPNGGAIAATTVPNTTVPATTMPSNTAAVPPKNVVPGQDANSSVTLAPAETKIIIPLNGTVSRKFGWVEDSSSGLKQFHEGIDIKADRGSKVVAALAGTVTKIGENGELGKYVLITHNTEKVTLYSQLEGIKVQQAQTVKGGDLLGAVGKPVGVEETQPHLHFEIREKGEAVDPWAKLSKDGI